MALGKKKQSTGPAKVRSLEMHFPCKARTSKRYTLCVRLSRKESFKPLRTDRKLITFGYNFGLRGNHWEFMSDFLRVYVSSCNSWVSKNFEN